MNISASVKRFTNAYGIERVGIISCALVSSFARITMRIRMAVLRMRMRRTMLRIRITMWVLGLKSKKLKFM